MCWNSSPMEIAFALAKNVLESETLSNRPSHPEEDPRKWQQKQLCHLFLLLLCWCCCLKFHDGLVGVLIKQKMRKLAFLVQQSNISRRATVATERNTIIHLLLLGSEQRLSLLCTILHVGGRRMEGVGGCGRWRRGSSVLKVG